MASIGKKLARERQGQSTTIEEIAVRTGIGLAYLQALERDDFAALPGRAFGKLYIRAYAEVLGFDPEGLIGDYDEASNSGVSAACPETRRDQARSVWQAALRKSLEESRETRMRSKSAPGGAPGERVAEPPVDAEEPPAPGLGDDSPTGDPAHCGVEAPPPVPQHGSPAEALRRAGWRPLGLTSFSIALLVIAAWIFLPSLRTGGSDDREPEAATASIPSPAPAQESGGAATTVDDVRETLSMTDAAEPVPERATPPSPEPSATRTPPGRLAVDEFGLGERVVDRRLEGRKDVFEEGGAAVFFTRVIGGRSGQHVRHVWLRDGRVVQAVELPLGGAHWRTHSRKTLWGTGSWAVEARDSRDRVLARASFTCLAASR